MNEQSKERVPFCAEDGSDPFYSESNIRELKRRMEDIKNGTAVLEEHELICTEDSSDPFYSESNIRELMKRIEDIKNGTAVFREHELVEVE